MYVNKKNRLFSALLPLENLLLNVIYCLLFKFKRLQCGLLRPASCTDRVIHAFPNKTCRPPLAPKYFLQSFNGTPHPLVMLELSRGAGSSGTVCELERVFQNDSQTFSSCQCYDSYTLLFIHVCSRWNFGFSLHETSLSTHAYAR